MVRGPARHGAVSALLCACLLSAVAAAAPAAAAGTSAAAAAGTATGSLVLRAITPPGAPRTPFKFVISCTGDAAPIERTVVVRVVDGLGAATVAGIPLDMACLVTDHPAAGWRVETANPQAAVASAAGTPVEFGHSAPAAATLSLVKTSDPDGAYAPGAAPPPVTRGSLITYTLTYRNAGDLPVTATVTDAIPAGTAYAGGVRCLPACASPPTVAAGRIRFTVSAGADETGILSYAVKVADDAADGDVLGSPAVIEPGPAGSNAVLHRVSVPRAGLRVTAAVDRDSAPAGAVIAYAIEVANRGSARQDGVTVTDAVPANADYVAGSATCAAPCQASYDAGNRSVTWRVGSLEADEIATGLSFLARVRAGSPDADGSLPATVVLDAAIASSTITRATPSNQVKTVAVAVLARKVVRPRPLVQVGAPAPTLPATGAPVGLLLAVGVGLVLAGSCVLSGERRLRCRPLASREPAAVSAARAP